MNKDLFSLQEVWDELEERIEDLKSQFRKPTHGNCCTCQTCGQYHDDCVCLDIDFYESIKFFLTCKEANE